MRIGVVGDVHLDFDRTDVEQLDAERYDTLLFVGDLGGYSHRGGLEVARTIAELETPTLVIPGNHDAAHLGQLAAEVIGADALIPLLGLGQSGRERDLEAALGEATVAGYSRHRLVGDRSLDVIAARPHSMGGPRIAFRPHLRERFGVEDFEDSFLRLRALIDESDADELLFFAHNGPSGLGARAEDIWGCDFRKAEGDFGDVDLERAIEYAERTGRRIRAVVAGHMHHELRGGGLRRWRVREREILYVNAARVPRIFEAGTSTLRHHVELVIGDDDVRVREVLLSS